MDSVREGEGGKIWENGIETCKISCMKQVSSPGLMHDTGCLGLVHWDNPAQWLIDVNVWQKPPQYCKVISLQL